MTLLRRLAPGIILLTLFAAVAVGAALYFFGVPEMPDFRVRRPATAKTFSASEIGLGEPFGIAFRDGAAFVSDGHEGKIWKIEAGYEPVVYASGLHTPSAIAFDHDGNLIVADSGSHTVKSVNTSGEVFRIAGTDGRSGDADGPADTALFNAPVGVTVLDDGSIAVSDTYNDKIKLIKDGVVTTSAGSTRGFADGPGTAAQFDTPTSVAPWSDGRLLVADALNGRVRVVEPDGRVWTLAANPEPDPLAEPTAEPPDKFLPSTIAVGPTGDIFLADRHIVRSIRQSTVQNRQMSTEEQPAINYDPPRGPYFYRISGLSFDRDGDLLVTDSESGAIRVVSFADLETEGPPLVSRKAKSDPAEFRQRQPARWPYDPPEAVREIAGTLGEIRGHIVDETSHARFHNGLDIAGDYGERAVFVRDEKVLDPFAAENFDTPRELIRLPSMGYIHISLGRDGGNRPFGDERFQFDPGMKGVRVRRGTFFRAGDAVGTLNSQRHVHLIAGPVGDEMNALDALELPGVSDGIAPTIQDVKLFDRYWLPIETEKAAKRIRLTAESRVIVHAFDRMDGNEERRRLGAYRVGYQVLNADHAPTSGINWNISFERSPAWAAVRYAYAPGSRSGASGGTSFRYIVTNKVSGDEFSEGFLDPATLAAGEYILRVYAADYFGNISSKDISFEVAK
jgi:hypothetical protein